VFDDWAFLTLSFYLRLWHCICCKNVFTGTTVFTPAKVFTCAGELSELGYDKPTVFDPNTMLPV